MLSQEQRRDLAFTFFISFFISFFLPPAHTSRESAVRGAAREEAVHGPTAFPRRHALCDRPVRDMAPRDRAMESALWEARGEDTRALFAADWSRVRLTTPTAPLERRPPSAHTYQFK